MTLLPPRVSPQLQSSILARTLHFLDLKLEPEGKKNDDKPQLSAEDQKKALKEIFAKFGVMYAALMFMNTTAEGLSVLIRSVEDYTRSADADHRERSTRLILYLLSKFFEYKVKERMEDFFLFFLIVCKRVLWKDVSFLPNLGVVWKAWASG